MKRRPYHPTPGDRFGRLIVLGPGPKRGNRWTVLVRCECGAEKAIEKAQLTSGKTKSCGCLMKLAAGQRVRTHGMSGTPVFKSWSAMIARCEDPRSPAFERYGARGIRVCERWHDPTAFLADMGERPAGTSIDRIDNDRGYEPGNCRWATRSEQNRNQRRYLARVIAEHDDGGTP